MGNPKAAVDGAEDSPDRVGFVAVSTVSGRCNRIPAVEFYTKHIPFCSLPKRPYTGAIVYACRDDYIAPIDKPFVPLGRATVGTNITMDTPEFSAFLLESQPTYAKHVLIRAHTYNVVHYGEERMAVKITGLNTRFTKIDVRNGHVPRPKPLPKAKAKAAPAPAGDLDFFVNAAESAQAGHYEIIDRRRFIS